jgi:hypothetical protein
MTPSTPDTERTFRIFSPYGARQTREVRDAGRRFVYYTTAETAASILRNRQIWMRSTLAMNDYMEVEHGFECLDFAREGEPGRAFGAALDTCHPGLAAELWGFFDGWEPGIRTATYMTCVSEHLDEEDRRLVDTVVERVTHLRGEFDENEDFRARVRRLPTGVPDQYGTRVILTELVATMLTNSEMRLTRNHGIDLRHAVVPVSYCDLVLLDKHWTAQVEKVRARLREGGLDVPIARVFSERDDRVERFLHDLGNT